MSLKFIHDVPMQEGNGASKWDQKGRRIKMFLSTIQVKRGIRQAGWGLPPIPVSKPQERHQ